MSKINVAIVLSLVVCTPIARPGWAEDIATTKILIKDDPSVALKRLRLVATDSNIDGGDGYAVAPATGASLHVFSQTTANDVCSTIADIGCKLNATGQRVVCRAADLTKFVEVKPGRVKAKLKGFSGFELDAAADQLPISAVLRVGTSVYCTTCGGGTGDDVRRDGTDGQKVLVTNCAPAACPEGANQCALPPPTPTTTSTSSTSSTTSTSTSTTSTVLGGELRSFTLAYTLTPCDAQDHTVATWTNQTGGPVRIVKAQVTLSAEPNLFADLYAQLRSPTGDVIEALFLDHYAVSPASNPSMPNVMETKPDGLGFTVNPLQTVSMIMFCNRFNALPGPNSVFGIVTAWYVAGTGTLRFGGLGLPLPGQVMPCDGTLRTQTWTNPLGQNLRLRRAQLWMGFNGNYFGFRDASAELWKGTILVSRFHLDHFARFTGPHENATRFSPNWITVGASESLRLEARCTPASDPAGNDAAAATLFWYEPF